VRGGSSPAKGVGTEPARPPSKCFHGWWCGLVEDTHLVSWPSVLCYCVAGTHLRNVVELRRGGG